MPYEYLYGRSREIMSAVSKFEDPNLKQIDIEQFFNELNKNRTFLNNII